jgi:hypothetical protein
VLVLEIETVSLEISSWLSLESNLCGFETSASPDQFCF